MYICSNCGSKLIEAEMRVHEYSENLDGESGIEHRVELYCPYCGSDEIREMETGDYDI